MVLRETVKFPNIRGGRKRGDWMVGGDDTGLKPFKNK